MVTAGTGDFPTGGFDSLLAVEMSSSLSSSLGVKLPGTLVFDYPSVDAMAAYIHAQLAPARATAALVTNPELSIQVVADTQAVQSMLFNIHIASRLPEGHWGAREPLLPGFDGISLVPFDRWDLEAPRVSFVDGLHIQSCA